MSTEVARWMVAAGLRIDVASGGELAVALAAGVTGENLGLHGNNKSVAEIDRAVAARVGTIVVDSAQEIERVGAAAAAAGLVQRVRLRVNSGVHAHTHEFLATAHEDQKFGMSIADAPAIVAAIRAHASLEFVGLHCHIGSQIFDSGGFVESAKRLLGLHAELLAGGPVAELNLGGGFGIAYTSVDRPTDIAVIAAEMARVVGETCRDLGVAVPRVLQVQGAHDDEQLLLGLWVDDVAGAAEHGVADALLQRGQVVGAEEQLADGRGGVAVVQVDLRAAAGVLLG
jgi:diaminopimelate decarboxylase